MLVQLSSKKDFQKQQSNLGFNGKESSNLVVDNMGTFYSL